MAVSRCSKLFDYYSKLEKATACESESLQPPLLHCITRFQEHKIALSRRHERGWLACGLRPKTDHVYYHASGFFGLAGFCSSTFHSPLRITKKTQGTIAWVSAAEQRPATLSEDWRNTCFCGLGLVSSYSHLLHSPVRTTKRRHERTMCAVG